MIIKKRVVQPGAYEITAPFFRFITLGNISRATLFGFAIYKKIGKLYWILGVTFNANPKK